MFQKHHIITINSVVFKVIFELVPIAGFPTSRPSRFHKAVHLVTGSQKLHITEA
jgi:hypothetical protein